MKLLLIVFFVFTAEITFAQEVNLPYNFHQNRTKAPITRIEYKQDGIFLNVIELLYDENKNLISRTQYQADINNPDELVPVSRLLYVNDSRNNVKTETEQYYKQDEWVNGLRNYSEWDENGNQLVSAMMLYSKEKGWRFWVKFDMKYDKYNNQIYFLYSRDLGADTLTPRELTTRIYNDSNKLVKYIHGFFDTTYKIGTITYFDRNEKGLVSQISECWGKTDSIKNYTKFKYDDRNNIIQKEEMSDESFGVFKTQFSYLIWDADNYLLSDSCIVYVNSEFDKTGLLKANYDSKHNLTSSSYMVWNKDSMKLVKDEQDTYTYDERSNYLSRLHEIDSNNNWYPTDRSTYTYNEFNQETSEIFELYYDGYWENQSKVTRNFDKNGNIRKINSELWLYNNWYPGNNSFDFKSNNINYYFNAWDVVVKYDMTDSKEENEPTDNINIKIIPNPASDKIKISANTGIKYISLTDLSGCELLKSNLYIPGEDIDISGLTDGIYILTVKTAEKTFVRKIMKMK